MPFSYLFAKIPRWIDNRNFIRKTLPKTAQSWIYEADSLTRRLRVYYGSGVSVKILRQGWHKPFIHESQLLEMPPAHHSLIREVVLYADQTPLILARSVIPKTTIAVAQRSLSHLGTRPLGEVIFAYPNLQRLALEVAHVAPSTWTAACLNTFDLHQNVWGRRTVYAIPRHAMLVSEFFLPAVLEGRA